MMKKTIFSYNSGNHLHIQHQAPKHLNINAKWVVDNPAQKIFFLHHRVFFKRGHVLSQKRPSFKKR